MPSPCRSTPLLVAVATPIALSACHFDKLTTPFPPPELTGIAVGPTGATVQVGDTLRLYAIGTLSGLLGAFSYSPLDGAAWAISDPTVARLEPLPTRPPTDSTRRAEAIVHGVQPSIVRVTVSAGGIAGGVDVRVVPRIATSALQPSLARGVNAAPLPERREAGSPTGERDGRVRR